MGRLDGQVVVITGGSSGIGAACVDRCQTEGATVVGLDIDHPEVDPGGGFHAVDVTDDDAVGSAVDAVVDAHGRIDGLVNAAGVAGGGPVHLVEPEDWHRVIAVNLTGTFQVCRHVLTRTMVPERAGSIVNVGSIEGIEGTEGGSVYNASKGGVVLLTRNMAIDYGRLGIRVNALCPGLIDTPLMRSIFDDPNMAEYRERWRHLHSLDRFGRPEEMAAVALFLLSDDASFVTGHAMVADGGLTAGSRVGYSTLMGLD